MRKPFLLLSILASLFFFASCGDQKPKREIDAENGITGLEKDDPNFLRFKDTAQKYMEDFIGSLQEHAGDSSYYYAIKSDFTENDKHEHMWSSPFRFDNNGYTCVFMDSAFDLHNVKRGDTVFVKKSDVEDWVIYDYLHQTKMGSFSEKYLKGQE